MRTNAPATTAAPSRRRLKWHHVYYLLAGFDLATISFSLFLNHRILRIYTDSLALNRQWTERASRYVDLAVAAAAVNAPGNDLFGTADVEHESRRLDDAVTNFQRALESARADLATGVPEPIAGRLRTHHDRVAAAVGLMVDEARHIFRFFRIAEPATAGRHMAAMDRRYVEVRAALDALQHDVREIQQVNLRTQSDAAVALGRYEYVMGAFIVLMVLGITFYGHRLARKMEHDQRERESILESLRQAEAQTRAIVATAADAVVISDHRGNIESINPAGERMFGYVAAELVGENVARLMPSRERAEHGHAVERYVAGGVSRILGRPGREVLGQRRDGTEFPVEIAVSEVRTGGRHLYAAIIHDITIRKRAEALARKYNEELEATVRERTEGLRVALAKQSDLAAKNAQAYELVRRTQEELVRRERLAAVGEVSAAIAHGIRNPLASIRAAAEVQRDEVPGGGAIAETLDDIIAEVGRLEGRIRTVLDLAQPFRPALVLDDLNAFVRDFAAAIKNRIPGTVRFDVALDETLAPTPFDRNFLGEVLDAIVVNAFEAMNGGGQVTIRSLRLDANGEAPSVALTVTDTGPGIDPSRLMRIFDLFYTTKPSGTGIGLAMAKRLMECQGGRIEVASDPPRATTFTIRLPGGPPAARAGA